MQTDNSFFDFLVLCINYPHLFNSSDRSFLYYDALLYMIQQTAFLKFSFSPSHRAPSVASNDSNVINATHGNSGQFRQRKKIASETNKCIPVNVPRKCDNIHRLNGPLQKYTGLHTPTEQQLHTYSTIKGNTHVGARPRS